MYKYNLLSPPKSYVKSYQNFSSDIKIKQGSLDTHTVNSAPFLTREALKVSKVVFFSARLITNSAAKEKRD